MRSMEARDLALELMVKHDLLEKGWTFGWCNHKTTFGWCKHGVKRIELSRHLVGLTEENDVRLTILHEIAHALVGPRAGHSRVWQYKCLEIGGDGKRTHSVKDPTAPWVGTCPNGHTSMRHKRPTRVVSCNTCYPRFNADYLFTWKYEGREVRMDPRYVESYNRSTAGSSVAANSSTSMAAREQRVVPGRIGDPDAVLVGDTVRLVTNDRFDGTRGVVAKRGRTRFHITVPHPIAGVQTLTVPFHMVRKVS